MKGMITIENLRIIREKRGYSQLKVAMRINTSQEQISRFENGDREPSLKTLKELTRYLDTNTDYLIGITSDDRSVRERDIPNLTKEETQILNLYHKLAEEDKQKMLIVLLALTKEFEEQKNLTTIS